MSRHRRTGLMRPMRPMSLMRPISPSSLRSPSSLICPMILACLLCLTSCEYKDLCYDHNHWTAVRVTFDWVNDPDADPQGMTVLFYNEDNSAAEPTRYDLPGRDGGTVRLIPGTWSAMAYNYDTETILYRGMERTATLEAYTRLSSIGEGTQLSRADMPRAASTEEEPVILEPDALWGCKGEAFRLVMDAPGDYEDTRSRAGEKATRSADISMKPYYRVCDVTITIHNVPNLQYTGQFGAALSGLAPSVWMMTGQPGDGRATQAFTCSPIDGETLQMKVRIFGHCPHRDDGEVNTHLLTIYAILADGTKWYYTYDVTQQMHDITQSPDDYHIYIDLDGLPIPKPIVNGSGFRPTVDGWQSEEIEVTM